jgi:hypothetical protein
MPQMIDTIIITPDCVFSVIYHMMAYCTSDEPKRDIDWLNRNRVVFFFQSVFISVPRFLVCTRAYCKFIIFELCPSRQSLAHAIKKAHRRDALQFGEKPAFFRQITDYMQFHAPRNCI